MILSDSLGTVVDFAYTDAAGDFLIEQLDPSTYMVRAEVFAKRADEVWFQLATGHMQQSALDFEVKETEVVFVGSVSVDALENSPQLKAFPNPAQGYLVVSGFEDALLEKVVLIDLSGKAIPINWRKKGTEVVLELAPLARGSYMVQLHFKTYSPLHIRVIKE
jgi:hypothetical protein